MKLTLIIPVFNERRWLAPLWERLKNAPLEECPGIKSVELLFINDGSTDGSHRVLARMVSSGLKLRCGIQAEVRLIGLPKNQGKGAAIRAGIANSTGDIVAIQDADLEYSPNDLPTLLRPFFDQKADAVIGSRFDGSPRRALFFWHSVWNRWLSLLCSAFNNIYVTDIESGYKAARGEIIRSFSLRSSRFGIEPELVSRMAHARLRLYEVPISYQGRTYQEGKKIGWLDALAAVFHTVRFAFFDREPYKPGLRQALTAIEGVGEDLYVPLLQSALSKVRLNSETCEILEIGSGMGALTGELLNYGKVTATDLSQGFVEHLRKKFSDFPQFESRQWDATQELWEPEKRFDLIVACNVLEHIEGDSETLRKWQSFLKPGGYLILIVPQYRALFSAIDKAAGHFCRYSKKGLEDKLSKSGFSRNILLNGNAMGLVGWIVTSCLLRRAELSKGSLKLYVRLKPIIYHLEKFLQQHVGLSLISVSQKQS